MALSIGSKVALIRPTIAPHKLRVIAVTRNAVVCRWVLPALASSLVTQTLLVKWLDDHFVIEIPELAKRHPLFSSASFRLDLFVLQSTVNVESDFLASLLGV
jgi:hypothetical protein